jgi:hypothetical protein
LYNAKISCSVNCCKKRLQDTFWSPVCLMVMPSKLEPRTCGVAENGGRKSISNQAPSRSRNEIELPSIHYLLPPPKNSTSTLDTNYSSKTKYENRSKMPGSKGRTKKKSYEYLLLSNQNESPPPKRQILQATDKGG